MNTGSYKKTPSGHIQANRQRHCGIRLLYRISSEVFVHMG